MNAEAFRQSITDYILSAHAYLHIPTTETARFLSELNQIASSMPEDGRLVFSWSQATGWRDIDGNTPSLVSGVQFGQPDAQKAPQETLDLPENSIFVLKDFGFYLQHKTYSYADVVVAWLREIRDTLANSGRTIIFLGPEFTVPTSLANDLTTIDFPLPDAAAIESSVRFVMEGHDVNESALPAIIGACQGMTQQQVEDRTALALRRYKTLDEGAAALILREKAGILRRGGLLRYQEPPDGGLNLIGGNSCIKQHIARDKICFAQEARSFGIDPPRGIMLAGISGCGKTQISLCAASELGIPLVQFDVGSMMSKWVGETEANVRTALQQVQSMAPCVLQMDEVEKGFGGVGSEGDSGASLRAFGTVLKWMSERTCPVYIIMTANDVSRLPPEFTRKGRIDEIFGIGLPTAQERAEILTIHLKLKGRDPQLFDVANVVDATEGYTGADIKEVVATGLKLAFCCGQELTTDYLLEAVLETKPLTKTDPERVVAMAEWLAGHTRSAHL